MADGYEYIYEMHTSMPVAIVNTTSGNTSGYPVNYPPTYPANPRQLHRYAPVLRPLADGRSIESCGFCGHAATDKRHAVPEAQEPPFRPGQMVRATGEALSAGIIGRIGRVIQRGDFTLTGGGTYLVEFEEPPGSFSSWLDARHLKAVERPPKFSSVEEAQKWLEEHS